MDDIAVEYGRLHARNPYVGYFKHAPRGTHALAARVLDGQVVSPAEYMRAKANRRNVHTGIFHKAPGVYSDLHVKFVHNRHSKIENSPLDVMKADGAGTSVAGSVGLASPPPGFGSVAHEFWRPTIVPISGHMPMLNNSQASLPELRATASMARVVSGDDAQSVRTEGDKMSVTSERTLQTSRSTFPLNTAAIGRSRSEGIVEVSSMTTIGKGRFIQNLPSPLSSPPLTFSPTHNNSHKNNNNSSNGDTIPRYPWYRSHTEYRAALKSAAAEAALAHIDSQLQWKQNGPLYNNTLTATNTSNATSAVPHTSYAAFTQDIGMVPSLDEPLPPLSIRPRRHSATGIRPTPKSSNNTIKTTQQQQGRVKQSGKVVTDHGIPVLQVQVGAVFEQPIPSVVTIGREGRQYRAASTTQPHIEKGRAMVTPPGTPAPGSGSLQSHLELGGEGVLEAWLTHWLPKVESATKAQQAYVSPMVTTSSSPALNPAAIPPVVVFNGPMPPLAPNGKATVPAYGYFGVPRSPVTPPDTANLLPAVSLPEPIFLDVDAEHQYRAAALHAIRAAQDDLPDASGTDTTDDGSEAPYEFVATASESAKQMDLRQMLDRYHAFVQATAVGNGDVSLGPTVDWFFADATRSLDRIPEQESTEHVGAFSWPSFEFLASPKATFPRPDSSDSLDGHDLLDHTPADASPTLQRSPSLSKLNWALHHAQVQANATFLLSDAIGARKNAIAEDFELGAIIGDGGYACVRAAYAKATKEPCVIKCIRKRYLLSDEEKDSVKREVEIQCSLSHPHIVELRGAYEDTKEFVYLVLERVSGGDLHSFIRNKCVRQFSEIQVRVVLDQILSALDYLHSRGILHADVKPSNILIAESPVTQDIPGATVTNPTTTVVQRDQATGGASGTVTLQMVASAGNAPSVRKAGTSITGAALTSFIDSIKLCDFGAARRSRDARYYRVTGDVGLVPWTSVQGTMGYIAPEILSRQHYGTAVDIWSVGIIMFEMLAGYAPFYPYGTCLTEPVSFASPLWDGISQEAKALCRAMLTVDPGRRITAARARAHPFFAILT